MKEQNTHPDDRSRRREEAVGQDSRTNAEPSSHVGGYTRAIHWLAGGLALLATSCSTSDPSRTGAPETAKLPAPLRAEVSRQVTEEGDNSKPFIVARPGGGAYLTWARRDAGQTSVCFAMSRDGSKFEAPLRISSEGMALDLGAESGPSMAVATDRTIHIVWVAGSQKEPSDSADQRGHGKMPPRPGNLNIYFATSRDDGKSFSPPKKINDDESGAEHRFPTVAVDARGAVHVVWLDKRRQSEERPDFSRVYFARSTDGGKSFSANVDATRGQDNGICHCCKLALAVHPRRGIFVAFRNAVNDVRDMYLVRSENGDSLFSKPVSIENTRWMIPGCPMNGPSLAFDMADRLHAVWLTGGIVSGEPAAGLATDEGNKVLYRLFDTRTQSWSESLFLAVGSHPRLAVDARGTAYVAWEKDGLHLARLSTHEWTPIKSIQLSTTGVTANFATLTMASDGPLLVAWQQRGTDGRQQIHVAKVAVRELPDRLTAGVTW